MPISEVSYSSKPEKPSHSGGLSGFTKAILFFGVLSVLLCAAPLAPIMLLSGGKSKFLTTPSNSSTSPSDIATQYSTSQFRWVVICTQAVIGSALWLLALALAIRLSFSGVPRIRFLGRLNVGVLLVAPTILLLLFPGVTVI